MPDSLLYPYIPRFAKARVLVIGDIIMDHFLWGAATRISPEAPVPVVNVHREDYILGGSANVLRNVVSLGGQAALCGIIGQDVMGHKLLELTKELGVSTDGVIFGQRPTTIKTRVIAQGQQIVRVDKEQAGAPSKASLDALSNYLEKHLAQFDAVIVSDYAKGVVNEAFMMHLHQALRTVREKEQRNLPLIVDPKPANAHLFVGATVITPNHHEAIQITGMRLDDEQGIAAVARHLRDEIGCKAVLITRGEAGMALLQEDDTLALIPTMAKAVFDVTGAGDTVAATLALALASGCPMREAAILANYAAGIVVAKVGTACVSTEELMSVLPQKSTG